MRSSETPAASKAAPKTPSPAGFPRVEENTQKARDNDRRKILEQEQSADLVHFATLVAGSRQAGQDLAQDALLDQIRALPGNARARGRSFEISNAALAKADAPLRVEGDWKLRVPDTWNVHANGVCEGGDVEIVNPAGARTIRVSSPFCDPVVTP